MLNRPFNSFPVKSLPAFVLLLVAGLGQPAVAAEPYLEFVAGLVQRGYFDTAEEYLKSLETRPGVPDDIRQLVPYELGVLYRDSANSLIILDDQRGRLEEAQAAFERFARTSPNHPYAGRANSERAKLLLKKGQVDIWDAEGTSDPARQQLLRSSARKQVTESRQIYTTAAEQLKKNFEAFPGFIPPEQKQQLQQRKAAEDEYIQVLLDLAETIYWEAQTYPRDEPRRRELLTQAMLEFEKIHTPYREQIGGLLGRLWQGKSLEEMGETTAALGIYRELLNHPGSTPSMLALQAKARQFQLICYNHPDKREYRLVNQLAAEWLNAESNRRARLTDTGRGIEWEQARALEQLGQLPDLPENERKTALTQALGIARNLSRSSGPYKAPSSAMVARLTGLLGRDSNDPTDFNSAFGRAEELFSQAQELTDAAGAAVSAGNASEAHQKADARRSVAAEMTRLLAMGLRFREANLDESLQRRAELMLAVGYYYQERYFEAAAVAGHFLRNNSTSEPEMLRLAGQIAFAAMNDSYQAADEDDREFEKQHVLKLVNMLATRWPNTDLAVEAHLSAGRMFFEDQAFSEAADSWLKVPESSKSYGVAQLRAGAAYQELYAHKSLLPEAERPSADDLNRWRTDAEKYLQSGVNYEEARTGSEAVNPDLLRGKLALAQLRSLNGIYRTQGDVLGSVEILTQDPHSLTKAVEIASGEKRPADATQIKSRQFASLVYQNLLRAQIGARDLEAARDARVRLEDVAAGSDSAALTAIFVQFGQQLQEELDQLRASGSTDRLAEVRQGFESFLKDLYDRDESQQTFNSLLWIAETYTSLGEGTEEDAGKSREYFDRAATAYDRIISRGEREPAFLGEPQNALAVRVRMLECRIRQKDFESAERVLFDVLKESPNAPNVQESGARLYQAWGSTDPTKFVTALAGRKDPVHVWGWGELSTRMRGQAHRPELRGMYFTATRNYAETFLQQAARQSGDERLASLRNGLQILDTMSRQARDLPDETYADMNSIYRLLLKDLGEPVVSMPRGSQVIARAEPADAGGQPASDNTTAPATATPAPADGTAPATTQAAPASTSNMTVILVLLVLLAAGAAIIWWFLQSSQREKKKRAARLAAIASASASASAQKRTKTKSPTPGKTASPE